MMAAVGNVVVGRDTEGLMEEVAEAVVRRVVDKWSWTLLRKGLTECAVGWK